LLRDRLTRNDRQQMGTLFEPGDLVDVAVNSGQPARNAFTYRVPEGLRVSAGQGVFVPFGPRIMQGIVLGAPDHEMAAEARDVETIADQEVALDEAHLALVRWLSATYLAPLWDCIAPCLPSGYGQKPVTMVSPVEIPPLLPIDRQDHKILRYLGAHGQVSLDTLREATGSVTHARLRQMQEQGLLSVTQGLARPTARPKYQHILRLTRPPADALKHARALQDASPRSVAARLLIRLAEDSPLSLGDARRLGASRGHVDALAGEGWLEQHEERVDRDPVAGYSFQERPPLELTAGQQAAAEQIWQRGGTTLLHGVTGSGKTEVYLDLVGRTLREGRSAIVLVPEISLTPQAIRRYGDRFGQTLAVFHSALGGGELFDQWYQVHDGTKRLILGSRSALFAPAQSLGLIVLDEEHEWSYKQTDPQPRYHAREAAMELARLCGARLVLGSATPDVVTYYRSEQGRIGRVELSTRVAPASDGSLAPSPPPEVTVVDMREELKSGNRRMFSFALDHAIRDALAAGDQALLFVNRRGSARFILCRDCGLVPQCPTCGVALSLQAGEGTLPRSVCHHCGRTRKLDERCPRCRSPRYRPFGVGTQRVEQEARSTYAKARVARWDSDTASQKGSHERLVAALEAGEIDIIVGTQVLAKGLDLPRLSVVGVVDADVGLNLPTYEAAERTYQLLTQVGGRAGRREKPGRVFIQTYEPDAGPIQAAATGDYRAFYEDECAHRRRAGYPPFARLVRLLFRHSNEELGIEEASRVARELRTKRDAAGRTDPEVLGPTPAYVRRLRGEFRWTILLRGRDPALVLAGVRLGNRWTVDVDPVGLL
jgi:primosomal protein N' (replication factor Y)